MFSSEAQKMNQNQFDVGDSETQTQRLLPLEADGEHKNVRMAKKTQMGLHITTCTDSESLYHPPTERLVGERFTATRAATILLPSAVSGGRSGTVNRHMARVIEVISGRPPHNYRELECHFPNTARRVREIVRYEVTTPTDKNKDTNWDGGKRLLKRGRNHPHIRVVLVAKLADEPFADSDIDPLLWRRVHLAAVEADRHKKAGNRRNFVIGARVERLEAYHRLWWARVQSQRSARGDPQLADDSLRADKVKGAQLEQS